MFKKFKPTEALKFNGDPDCQRGFVEDIVFWLGYMDKLILWNLACQWFNLPEVIYLSSSGMGFINMDTGEFSENYMFLGVDDDTIVNYLLDAMEHGELSILNDGTIKF